MGFEVNPRRVMMRMVSRLQEFFENRANNKLRSIVKYDADGMEIVYIRDDVSEQYTDEERETAIDESRMESLHVPIYEHAFSENHGDLQCMVNCFENVIEMNFAIEDGVGVAVAMDAEAMDDAHGLVSEARKIAIEERT